MDKADPHDAGDWLDSLPPEQVAALRELLAISVRDLDAGLGIRFDAGDLTDLLARGRARRAAEARAAAE